MLPVHTVLAEVEGPDCPQGAEVKVSIHLLPWACVFLVAALSSDFISGFLFSSPSWKPECLFICSALDEA